MSEITREDLQALLVSVTEYVDERVLDDALEKDLNETFSPADSLFNEIQIVCHSAIKAGWMCKYEAGGIRYGRVIKPSDVLKGFSVDVVDMENIRGPHHRHPKGEIDMVMPLDVDAQFDCKGAGWKVYKADTAHYPTVTNGRVLVLYLLPAGDIEFTNM